MVLVGFLGAVYAAMTAWQRSQLRDVERVMRTVAEALGGEVRPGRANMFTWVAPVLEVVRGKTCVQARVFQVPRRGESTSVSTRVSAPVFRVRPAGAINGWLSPGQHPERPLGGHEAFDACFVVAAADHDAVGRLMSTAVRESLVELPELWLTCDGTTIDGRLGAAGAAELQRLVAAVLEIAAAGSDPSRTSR